MGVIFLSDIVTADRKYAEQWVTRKTENEVKSMCNFSKENQSKDDWKTWIDAMKSITKDNYQLMATLGDWCNETHRKSIWFYNKENSVLLYKKEVKRVTYTQRRSIFTGIGQKDH